MRFISTLQMASQYYENDACGALLKEKVMILKISGITKKDWMIKEEIFF